MERYGISFMLISGASKNGDADAKKSSSEKTPSSSSASASASASAAAASAVAAASATEKTDGEGLHVMTLNELCHEWTSHNFPAGPNLPKSVETEQQKIARNAITDAHILSHRPDAVLLQEVGSDRWEIICKRFGAEYDAFLVPNQEAATALPYKGGCAVLIRRVVMHATAKSCHAIVFKTQRPQSVFLRTAVACVVERDANRSYAFVSVHLDGLPTAVGDELRIAQVCEAVDFARARAPKAAIILGGDFNQPLETMGPLIKAMELRGMYCVDNKTVTFPEKGHVLDYLFVSDRERAKQAVPAVYPVVNPAEKRVPPYQWAGWGSDHLALSVRFVHL